MSELVGSSNENMQCYMEDVKKSIIDLASVLNVMKDKDSNVEKRVIDMENDFEKKLSDMLERLENIEVEVKRMKDKFECDEQNHCSFSPYLGNHHPENDSVEDPVISSLQRLTSRQVSQIDSLIEIETKFCSDLNFLRIHYYEPLKSSSLISRQALRFVFPACLFQILSFHSNILKNVRSVFILKELEQIKQILAIYSDAFSPNSDLGRLHMTYEISAVTTFAKIYFYDESDCVTFLNFYQEHLKSVKKLESTAELRLQFLLDMLRRPWQVFGRYRLIFERMWDDFSTNDRERCDFLLDFFERMENIFRQENREDPITRNIVDQWEFGYRENWSLESFSTERKNTQRYQSMIALLPQASNESNDQIQMDHSPSTPFNERHECPIGNKKEKSKSRLYKKNDHRENSIINFKRSSASSIVAFFKKGRGSTAVMKM